MTGKRALAIVLVIVVGAAVTAGIVIIGSPAEERTRRLDTRRVEDLQRISGAVEVYHQRHQRVPLSLEELSKEPGLSAVARDPVIPPRLADDQLVDMPTQFPRQPVGQRSLLER